VVGAPEQDVDPYTGEDLGDGCSLPYDGIFVDAYTGLAPAYHNANAYTATRDVDPATDFENAVAAAGGGRGDTSQWLATNGPIPANDSGASMHFEPASSLYGETPVDSVPLQGNAYLPDGSYTHFVVTRDGKSSLAAQSEQIEILGTAAIRDIGGDQRLTSVQQNEDELQAARVLTQEIVM
jgi:hypothetical protein